MYKFPVKSLIGSTPEEQSTLCTFANKVTSKVIDPHFMKNLLSKDTEAIFKNYEILEYELVNPFNLKKFVDKIHFICKANKIPNDFPFTPENYQSVEERFKNYFGSEFDRYVQRESRGMINAIELISNRLHQDSECKRFLPE